MAYPRDNRSSAVCAVSEAASAFTKGSHGTTYGGNPVCAVAVKHNCLDNRLIITSIGESIIRLAPPLIASKEGCAKAYEIIKNAVLSCAGRDTQTEARRH